MEEKKPGFIRRNFKRLMTFISALRLFTANLLFLVLIGLLFFIFSASELPSVPKKGALLLNIKGSLVDQKNYVDPVSLLMGNANASQQETLVQDVIDAINYASTDSRITSLVLSLDDMAHGGISKMQEIAPAIAAFRATGKKVVSIGDSYSQDQYWLATQADEVYLHPMGLVLLEGYGSYRNYFKQALDKLEINFHVFRVGEYKSAMEPFMRNDMSEEAKRASSVWLESLWNEYTRTVAERRNLPDDAVDQYINGIDQLLVRYQGDAASAAVASGLVDGLKARDEMNSYLLAVAGAVNKDGEYQSIGFEKYLWLQHLELRDSGSEAKVGVIVASGNIVDGEQASGAIGGDSLAALIRSARRNEAIRALVLRVDSGGGSAFASEIIRRELELFQQAGKPLVVSMGSVAASGGYWISAHADEIWALPTTLTGSIGIFGVFPTIDKTLDNLGINTDGVGTTGLAGALRIDRPLQPIAARSIQAIIDHGYAQFLDIVASGRQLSKAQVAALAEGRVWSGSDALRLGLVDKLGTLTQAIESAAALASLDQYERELIEIPLSPQEQFFKELVGEVGTDWLPLSFATGHGGPGMITRLQRWLRPFADSLAFIEMMNDPQDVYLHCTACVAP